MGVMRPVRAWTVRTWWLALPGESALEDGFRTTDGPHATWEPARKEALSLTCCRGSVAVVVYDPDGDVFAHWDRFSNIASHMWGDEATKARADLSQGAWDDAHAEEA